MKNLILSILIVCFAITSQAQEIKIEKQNNEKKESLLIKVKEGQNPDVYIDGKKYDAEILELLDQNKIESVKVIKDEQAKKEYNAPNGVVLIETKRNDESKILITGQKSIKNGDPKIFIDGEVSDQKILEKISPDDIYSIDVVKGEKAMKDYNAPNGVILITTKKKQKEKK